MSDAVATAATASAVTASAATASAATASAATASAAAAVVNARKPDHPLVSIIKIGFAMLSHAPPPAVFVVTLAIAVLNASANAKNVVGGKRTSPDVAFMTQYIVSTVSVMIILGLLWFFVGFPLSPIPALFVSILGVMVSVSIETVLRKFDSEVFKQQEAEGTAPERRRLYLHAAVGVAMAAIVGAIPSLYSPPLGTEYTDETG